MKESKIETGKAPQLVIKCRGDLRVRGWAETSVAVQSQEFTHEEKKETHWIEGTGDINLMVPTLSTLSIESVNGDLLIKNVEGSTTIASAMGDVFMENTGAVNATSIFGDLTSHNVLGSLQIDDIKGDLLARNVHEVILKIVYGDCAVRSAAGSILFHRGMGDILLENIEGEVTVSEAMRDLSLRNVGGLVAIDQVHGDIRLRGQLVNGKHRLAANGDIVVRWPQTAPVTIEASAPKIKRRIEMEIMEESADKLIGKIGDGGPFLKLAGSGSIIIKELKTVKTRWQSTDVDDLEFDFDLNGIGVKIADEINNRMYDWTKRMEEEFGPKFASSIEQKAQDAANRAEQAAKKAMRQAEKAARKARWQAQRSGWSGKESHRPPSSTKTKSANTEEQLKILKMVENGIITPDEASTLLEAIEG